MTLTPNQAVNALAIVLIERCGGSVVVTGAEREAMRALHPVIKAEPVPDRDALVLSVDFE